MGVKETFHRHARQRRARDALAVLVVAVAGLGLAFFETQVLDNAAYALRSRSNRLRPLSVPAPRGAIYDRNGEVVADNVPGYAVSLLPAPTDSLRAALERLAPLLDLTDARVDALLDRHRRFPGRALVVRRDLTFVEASAIEERRAFLRHTYIETRPKRRYPAGPGAAHVVGYVGEISSAELARPEGGGYRPGQLIGQAGLERQYERILRGEAGVRYVEVDAWGRVVGDVAPAPRVEPVPGRDLRLYLDLELQRWVHRAFPDSLRGAVVALEPRTGHVLALYSHPTYDPSVFVGGVAPERWERLAADSTDPLLNRATAGLYPPGSTFKLATAAVGLELGVVEPREYMPIPCRGGMWYAGRYFRCWKREGHGYLALADAIGQSCNVYFYQLGLKIGLERLLVEANRMGFGAATGIDLPSRAAGRFPNDPGWYRERFGRLPEPSEVLNLAIGQGPNAQTPLKMAHLYAALANGGYAPAPRIAAVPTADDGAGAIRLDLSEETLTWLLEGMRRVVAPGGTAAMARLEHWDLLGKTGTAQNPHGPADAWFVGMAGPKDGRPEIVVAVLLEQGRQSANAARYAAETADYYLRRKHGMAVDTIRTLPHRRRS